MKRMLICTGMVGLLATSSFADDGAEPQQAALSFAAVEMHDQEILLTWKTEDVSPDGDYLVERSVDGESFDLRGETPALPKSERQHYMLADHVPQDGRVYYRLSSRNKLGEVTPIKTISIKVGQQGITVLPRRSTGKVYVTTGGASKSVSIMTSEGKKISEFIVRKKMYPVDLSNLPAGIYLLQSEDNGELSTARIEKI